MDQASPTPQSASAHSEATARGENGLPPAPKVEIDDAARSSLYLWLSSLFAREITVDAIEWHRTEAGLAFLDALKARLAQCAAGDGDAAAVAAMLGGDVPASDLAADLRAGFATLFLGVAGRRTAVPMASFYLEETARTHGAATQAMVAALRANHVLPPADFAEPEDHLATILAFVGTLAGRTPVEGAVDRNAALANQCDAIDQHLTPWLGAFVERAAQFDRSGLYGPLARVTAAFVADDAEQLRGQTEAGGVSSGEATETVSEENV